MFYTYVLKSRKDLDLYIGSTKDLKARFKKHNSGLVQSTRSRAPFLLVYYEAFLSERDARLREKQLKYRGNSRRQLLLRLKYSLAS